MKGPSRRSNAGANQRTHRPTNRYSTSALADLKAIPIISVARELGFVVNAAGNRRCKLPGHGDSKPSFQARKHSNTFICFGCGHRGSVIDLVMQKLGIDFPLACDWLQRAHLGANLHRHSPRSSETVRKPENERASHINADPEVYGWLLAQCPNGPSGEAYLMSRHISAKTQAAFLVGQVGDAKRLLQMATARWSLPRLEACGIISVRRTGPELIFPAGYLLFPFLIGSEVHFIQARALGSPNEKRWICPNKLRPPVFNLNALRGGATTITVCEGITDVLSAAELGLSAIGVLGAHGALDPTTMQMLKGKNVAILGDNDKAGKAFAGRIAQTLYACGLTVVSKRLPQGVNDLNDYLAHRKGSVL